jgi:protein-L-isoaspartate(D-aspartate) O-methyltransferase
MGREELVKELISGGVLKSKKVIAAFRLVPREAFVPGPLKSAAYIDEPLPIGAGQTISAPHMVAVMTEALGVKNGQKVLEVGTGSGYQAAILSAINKKGIIYTIELQPELFESAKQNLKSYKNVRVFSGDGSLGLPEFAPYDRIIATAGSPGIPKQWIKQLKKGGRIVAPVGSMYEQRLVLVGKKNGRIIEEDLNFPSVFVPLRGLYGWR